MGKSRLLLLVIVAAAVAAFFYFDFGRFFSLEYLKSQQAAFAAYYAQHRWQTIAIYFAVYVAVTALSLPGAAIMTLAGGALFGLLLGHGDRLVRLVDRRDARVPRVALPCCATGCRRSSATSCRPINDGIEQGGRVLPLHAAAGAAVSVLRDQPADGPDADPRRGRSTGSASSACSPAPIVYVNAGTQLAQIESLAASCRRR